VTAPAEPARSDLREWLAEQQRQVHIHRETLERQMFRLSTGPGWRIEQTARAIREDKTVESWLARQLRDLPGGER
jgi:glutathione S-transferase